MFKSYEEDFIYDWQLLIDFIENCNLFIIWLVSIMDYKTLHNISKLYKESNNKVKIDFLHILWSENLVKIPLIFLLFLTLSDIP